MYRDTNNLSPKKDGRKNSTTKAKSSPSIEEKPNLEKYESMTKEELIQVLVQAHVNLLELYTYDHDFLQFVTLEKYFLNSCECTNLFVCAQYFVSFC